MLIVRVELRSAITRKTTEIARMAIVNDGSGTAQKGDYIGCTYRGRNSNALQKAMLNQTVTRKGVVEGHPRLREHVWHLVSKMLKSMEYG